MACLPVLIHAEDRGQHQGSPFMKALTEPEHAILARLASQQAPAILLSPTLGEQTPFAALSSLVNSEDLNSGSHVCKVCSLPTEPSCPPLTI